MARGGFDYDNDECSEPGGRELQGDEGTAHMLMLAETGACPWCGMDEGELI